MIISLAELKKIFHHYMDEIFAITTDLGKTMFLYSKNIWTLKLKAIAQKKLCHDTSWYIKLNLALQQRILGHVILL